jgi:hypothetical protein
MFQAPFYYVQLCSFFDCLECFCRAKCEPVVPKSRKLNERRSENDPKSGCGAVGDPRGLVGAVGDPRGQFLYC